MSHFLRSSEPLPGVDWRRLLAAKSVDYNQDLVLKGRPLTWSQVEAGLPPPGVAGGVRAVSLAAPPMARLLADPMLSVKPREEWPDTLRRTRVLAKPNEWPKIVRGLHGRGMIRFLREDQLVRHGEQSLTNGVFGVPKGNIFAPGYDLNT